MILYHYTAHLYLPVIQQEGLSRGTVLINLSERLNAVWLTSDSTAADHGLAQDPEICEQLSRQRGRDTRMLNKLAVRITVKIPSIDPRLVYWPKWAKNRLDPYFYDAVAETGDNMDKTWWLYRGVISPSRFISIDILEPLTEFDLEIQKALAEGRAAFIDPKDIAET
jgi:hypothetical protein